MSTNGIFPLFFLSILHYNKIDYNYDWLTVSVFTGQTVGNSKRRCHDFQSDLTVHSRWFKVYYTR